MASSNQQTMVLVISNDERIKVVVKAALSREQDFVLPGHISLSEGYLEAVRALQPGIILLDYLYDQKKIFNIIDQLASEFPNISIIVIIPKEEANTSNRVILAGARAFVTHPFSQIDLVSTLRRVRELQARNLLSTPQDGDTMPAQVKNMFVVFSPKGGVGCTTIATNLALALQQEIGEEVLLIDGKHQFGHVAVFLNMVTKNSIADLIPYAGTLDKALIKQVVTPHSTGLEVLPCPNTIAEAQGIVPNDLYKVILALQGTYMNIVVDGGNSLTDNTVTYLDSASRILLIITPNIAALRDAYQFIGVCRTLSYPSEKILLIVNEVGRKEDIKLNEIEKALQMNIFCTIPVDDNVAMNSLNEGLPVILNKPNNVLSKAYKRIANQMVKLTSLSMPVQQGTDEKKTSNDLLSRTARLG